ncbi:unnamed protein product, partial [marine sediment metagenome]
VRTTCYSYVSINPKQSEGNSPIEMFPFPSIEIGLFAVGLWVNVKPEKEKIGNYLLMYVIAMSLAIGFFKQEVVNIVLG